MMIDTVAWMVARGHILANEKIRIKPSLSFKELLCMAYRTLATLQSNHFDLRKSQLLT